LLHSHLPCVLANQLQRDQDDDDPYVSLFSSELIQKHVVFESLHIVEYNRDTQYIHSYINPDTIEEVLDRIKVSSVLDEMPRDSWKANILQHHAHYQELCDDFVRSSIHIIGHSGQRLDWRSHLKSVLQSNLKKMDAPPVFKILEVLAVASAFLTVDKYAAISLKFDCGNPSRGDFIKPHATQIVSVLRLLV
jgi:hypothetical protein